MPEAEKPARFESSGFLNFSILYDKQIKERPMENLGTILKTRAKKTVAGSGLGPKPLV